MALSLPFAPAAWAFEAADISPCLSLLPSDIGIGAEVDLVAKIFDGRVDKVAVLRATPDNAQGQRVARAAMRALYACGPYGDLTHTVIVHFRPDEPDPAAATAGPPKR